MNPSRRPLVSGPPGEERPRPSPWRRLGFAAVLSIAGAAGATGAWAEGRVSHDPRWPAQVRSTPARAVLPPGRLERATTMRQAVRTRENVAAPARRGWVTIFSDDFESPFPAADWIVLNVGTSADAYWGDWTCWYGETLDESVGCAVAGSAGIGCNATYPDNMNAWMIHGPFDLSDPSFSAAEVTFDFKLNSEPTYDKFQVMASTDGSNFYGVEWSGAVEQATIFDLTDVFQIGNLLGQPQVWIAFIFTSDASGVAANGAQVDDVVVRAFQDVSGPAALAVGSAAGASGTSVTVELTLDNPEIVKGIQADIAFDPSVAVFSSASGMGRATGMTVTGRGVSQGVARVLLYYDDASTLAAGSGAVAELTFALIGAKDDVSELTPFGALLSDPAGDPLSVDVQSGSLTVTQGQAPHLTISALKNPGRTRSVQILVKVDHGSGSAPVVTAAGNAIAMSPLGSAVYLGQYWTPVEATSVLIDATDANDDGQGSDQVTVTF